MFWRVAGLATTSPVDLILDRDNYTLEELLDEDDLIQECKSLNQRLVQFLRGKQQVIQLVRYVIEEPPDDADDRRVFKYPFVCCEVFTCEIDHIFNTLLEDPEIMDLLFSFLNPGKQHSNLLAGYFSKVVICLLVRRTPDMMNYLQAHQDLLAKLVELIGVTSIMEVVMKLVGADDQILMYHSDCLQWLAGTNLLEMLVDRLSPKYSADEHANTAETLSAVARTAPSALATQLSSPKYIGHLFEHVLGAPQSKTGVIHSLSVCITLLDPKRAASAAAAGAARGVHQVFQPANPETVEGILQRLGNLLAILDISEDEATLPTTYGQLKPPLGVHRLKIVEFIAVLLRANSEGARQELIRLRAIPCVLDLFFRFPFNNMLHHHVENIINSCLDSNNPALIDHLLGDCNLIQRILDVDRDPAAPDTRPEPRAETKRAPSRSGYMGHVTRMANRLIHIGSQNLQVNAFLQGNERWAHWQLSVLQKRNQVENVFQWTCGRPAALDDRPGDSDEDEFGRDRDFDISTINLTNNLPREYHRYGMFDTEEIDLEGQGKDDLIENYDGTDRAMAGLRLTDEWEDSEEDIIDGAERSPSTSALGTGTPSLQKLDGNATNTDGDLAAGRASSPLSTGDGEGSPSQDGWFAFQASQSTQTITISRPVTPATHEIIFDDDDDEMDTASSSHGPTAPGPVGTTEISVSASGSDTSDDGRPTFSFNMLQKYVETQEPIDLFAGKPEIVPQPSPATQGQAPVDLFAVGKQGEGIEEPTFAGEPVFHPSDLEDDDDFDVRGSSRPDGGGESAPEAVAFVPPTAGDSQGTSSVEVSSFFSGSGSTPERGSPSPGASGHAPDFFASTPPVDLFGSKVDLSEVLTLELTAKTLSPDAFHSPANGKLEETRRDTPRPDPWELQQSGVAGFGGSQGGLPGEATIEFKGPPSPASDLENLLADANAVAEEQGSTGAGESGEVSKAGEVPQEAESQPSAVEATMAKEEVEADPPEAGNAGAECAKAETTSAPEVLPFHEEVSSVLGTGSEGTGKGMDEPVSEAVLGESEPVKAESGSGEAQEVPKGATKESNVESFHGVNNWQSSIDQEVAGQDVERLQGKEPSQKQEDLAPSADGNGGDSVQRTETVVIS